MYKKIYNRLRLIVLSLLTMVSSISYAYDFEVDGIYYSIINGNEVEVANYRYYTGDITIPPVVDYSGSSYNVTAIGENAFSNGGHNIKSITMPNTIITVGKRAFHSLWDIKTIIIPNSVITIGEEAFRDCQSLVSIDIPNNVISIGRSAFDYCLGLKFATLGNSIKEIGNGAFSRCNVLNSINIPNSVESIGRSAFSECSSLKSITIPNSVKTISTHAFWGCSGLNTVVSQIEAPYAIDETVFELWAGYHTSSIHSTLQVPHGTKDKYLLYSGWTKYFSNIIEDKAYYTCSIKALGSGSVTYKNDVIRDATKNYSLEEGSSVSLSLAPDNGFQIKSVKVNNTDVTSSVSNNTYTISSISSDTAIEVEFEAIPPTTYTLSISAIGNGSASYGGETIRGVTKTYTVNEGTSATITFTPDNGYQIKSLKVNNAAFTASTSHTLTVNANTTVEVEFEAIPPTLYTLTISASGNGYAFYGGETIKNATKTYSVNEGVSATISFTPDNGYRIKSLKVNSSAVAASNSYTVTMNSNTTVEVEFEAIPPTTYTLTIKAIGNGYASYGGEVIKNTTKTYTVNEGTSATISFTPDNGYRIKSLKVNSVAVTVSTSYTVTVNANTTVEVEFEAIPPTTYTLSIKATGNGSASYGGETIRGTTKSYTVNEGTSATITFTPDKGYRIKSLKVNSVAVTASTSYTVTVNSNTTVEVEFEAIPPTTYTLSIKATGNGSASYSGTTVRGATKSFTVNEGTSATITFSPDNGYRIKSLKVNSSAVTASTSYTVVVNSNTTVEVEFEAIPPTTYTLSIKATGNGFASYSGTTVRGATKSFTVNEGTSATITFSPDNGYRIKSLKVNSVAVTASTSYTVTVNSNTSVEVEFEAIPPTTYTLTIKAIGNGSASYDGTTIRSATKTFTVNEGTSATITFAADNGYRIKSLKVNSTAVTASTSYTVTVNSNTTVEVEFEAKPVVTYTLSIKATGNGSASYGGETIRGASKSFTVNEGTSATITFSPDNGYRVKSLKVNNSSVTASTSYMVTVSANTSVEVEFEEISDNPIIITTYTLSIQATGNGFASYGGKTIRDKTSTYTVEEGSKASITFTPDDGYRIKSLKVNGSSVTVSTTYEVVVNSDTSVKVEFEKIPDNPDAPTYNLSIRASGNGIASYDGEVIRDNIMTFTVSEGTSVTIAFTPDNGYEISIVTVNGADVTSEASRHQYTLTMDAETTVEVEFKESENQNSITIDGITYQIVSDEEHTLMLSSGDIGFILVVPEKIEFLGMEWTVIGIANNALENCEDLAAIIWNPEVQFNAIVTNPNLLLYVKDETYAPATIQNVVVNGYAKYIMLTDAQSGNNFYCPEAFTAQSIDYTHSYYMKTGFNESRGWETIALPFDVQMISHSSKGEIVPFALWTSGDGMKPFWLYELSGNGFVEAEAIKANTPFIISMPNNEMYPNEYQLTGRVIFSAENVMVEKSDEVRTATYSSNTFTPNFTCKDTNDGYYALNVSNDYEYYRGAENEGSKFILNLRKIHPFEAYMTSTSGTRSIDIFDGMATGIRGIEEIIASQEAVKVYDLSGRLIKMGSSIETIRQELPTGVYIINNKKMIIK